MRKVFLILFIFVTFLFSSQIKELKSLDDISEDKITFLVFSTDFCPWCAKQKKVLEDIAKTRDNLQIFYIDESNDLYEKLSIDHSLSIKYFPTTYVILREEGELSFLYEFQGYQRKSNILSVLDDENSF